MSVTYDKEGGYLSITENGVTYRRHVRVEDGVVSLVDPDGTSKKVDLIYVDASSQLVLVLEDETTVTVIAGAGDMTKAVYDAANKAAQIATGAELTTHEADTSTHGVTTVDGVTERDAAITSHAGAADPHTGYRLESADHTHQSTGAQAGKLDHGAALDGLTDDDHTQYQKESEKGAASGYASLDASIKVVEQPASISDFLEASPTNGVSTKAPDSNWAFDHNANASAHHTKYTDAEAIDAVEAAGLILADTKVIEHDPTPAASHTANGIIVTMTGGVPAGLVFGDACYVGIDGKMELALADDAAITIPATHLCIATVAENAAGLFLVKGWAHDDSWAFDVGLSVYLSAATAGLITKTMPVKVTGNQVQVLGTCLVADTIFWNPSMIVMEYA